MGSGQTLVMKKPLILMVTRLVNPLMECLVWLGRLAPISFWTVSAASHKKTKHLIRTTWGLSCPSQIDFLRE